MPRSLRRIILLLLTLALAIPAAASADSTTIPVATASASNIYSWCGQTALASLMPDTAPPASSSGCGLYSGQGAISNLTVTLAGHDAGMLAVSVYASNGTRAVTASVLVNGAQQGPTTSLPQNTTGQWAALPAVTVTAGDQVQVHVKADWYGTGSVLVKGVHATVTPTVIPWSQIGSPGDWATTPIPSTVASITGTGPHGQPLATEVPREIAGQAAGVAWPDFTAYSEQTINAPLSTPLEPVKLCEWGSTCVPNNGAATDDLWRAALGLANNAVPNRTTGACATNCTSLGGGVPVTASLEPSPGTDKAAVICLGGGDSGQPPWTLTVNGQTFTRPDGQQIEGNCWEVWGLRADPTYDPALPVSASNTQWLIAWGAHRTGFVQQPSSSPSTVYGQTLDSLSGQYCPRVAAGEWRCGGLTDAMAQQWFGPDVLTPGAADSTTYEPGWGVTAAELPLLTDVVQQADCQNVIAGTTTDFGHAIGVQLQYTRYNGAGLHVAWWPAGGSDGNNGNVATVEGMRAYWPASIQPPAGANAATLAVFRTIQRYGLVIDDQTGGGPAITLNADGTYKAGGALDIRYELASGANACTTLGWPALASLPWAQLRVIAQGSDAIPNPTG